MNRGYRRHSDITKKKCGRIKKIELEGDRSFFSSGCRLISLSVSPPFEQWLLQQTVNIVLPGKTPPNKQTCSCKKTWKLQNNYFSCCDMTCWYAGLLLSIGTDDWDATLRIQLKYSLLEFHIKIKSIQSIKDDIALLPFAKFLPQEASINTIDIYHL